MSKSARVVSPPVVEGKVVSRSRIAPIAPSQPEQSGGGGFLGFLKVFNPLGAISEAYAKTLTYRIESKRLNAEMDRVRGETRLQASAIDKTYRLKLEELSQRRLHLERFFGTVQLQLKHLHVERMTVLKTAERARELALSPGLALDERRFYLEVVAQTHADLAQFADRANQGLDVLLRALPPVQTPRLLEAGE
jgi:hypothetical protein